MKTWKIGEERVFFGVNKIKCIPREDKRCIDCCYDGATFCPDCNAKDRGDNTNVIFIKTKIEEEQAKLNQTVIYIKKQVNREDRIKDLTHGEEIWFKIDKDMYLNRIKPKLTEITEIFKKDNFIISIDEYGERYGLTVKLIKGDKDD